ncbi:MAG: hypothetical protein Kow0069_02830 [Promethearchaeota archaeon]
MLADEVKRMDGWLGRLASPTPWGVAGSCTILATVAVAAAGFVGPAGERYDLLNHFVSELGWVAVNPAAAWFNAGLLAGGPLLLVFMVALAARVGNAWAKAGGTVGVLAAACGTLVGAFPMDDLGPHALVAMGFFYGGMVAATLLSVAVVRAGGREETGAVRGGRLPRWLAVPGAALVVLFAAFNASIGGAFRDLSEGSSPADVLAAPSARPAVWPVAALEWAVVLGLLAWILLASLAARDGRGPGPVSR